MIGIIGLQQIQVIVKLPLHQLLWKSSTRSLLTAGSSTLDMCSTCCIPVYYYNSMYWLGMLHLVAILSSASSMSGWSRLSWYNVCGSGYNRERLLFLRGTYLQSL